MKEHGPCARMVHDHGEGSWSKLLPHFPGRIGKQLRERWHHELRPDIKKEVQRLCWCDRLGSGKGHKHKVMG